MANDFYARWFARTTPRPLTQKERWDRKTQHLRDLAYSPLAQELVEWFEIPEVEEAEAAFSAVLQRVSDPELRDAIDMAAGKISRAYQTLGFCVGHFSQDSAAYNP